MKSRRIILSDDEDESPLKESATGMVLSTPGSSTELLHHLSNLNVQSRTKIPANQNQLDNSKHNNSSSSQSKNPGIAAPQSEEDEFNSADELDAESTLKAMQGNLELASQEGEDYEAMIQPVRNKKQSPSATSASRTARSSNPGEATRTTSSRAQEPTSPVSRPRRQSAVRAEQLLQNIYSQYDKGDQQTREDEDSDSTHPQQDNSESDTGNRHNGDDERAEEDQDSYFIDNSGLPSPQYPKARSSSSRRTSSNHHRSSSSTGSGSRHTRSASDSPVDEAHRRASARTATISSRKEQEYQQAQQALRRASGLSTILLSSDEDSTYENDAEPRTQERTSDSDSHPRSSRGYSAQTSSSRSKRAATTYSYSKSQVLSPAKAVGLYRRDEQSGAESSGESDIDDFIVHSDEERAEEEERQEQLRLRKEQKRQQKKHKRSGDGSRAAGIVSAATARYNTASRGSARDTDHTNYTNNHTTNTTSTSSRGKSAPVITIDSDEEENEGEMVISRSSQKPTSTFSTSSSATMPRGSVDRGVGGSSSNASSSGNGGSGGRKRKVILDSDDEGVGNTNITTNNTTSSNTTRKKRRVDDSSASGESSSEGSGGSNRDSGSRGKSSGRAGSNRGSRGSGSKDNSNSEDSGSESTSGSSSDSEEDSDLDGPMLYYKVNSMRDRREEEGGLANLANMRKRFTIAEAMRYYVELLAHVLIDPHFLVEAHNPGSSRPRQHHPSKQAKQDMRAHALQMSQYTSATRQIENLIGTTRESLIGSGAWNKEFYADLQSRPFYSVAPVLCGDSSRNALGMYDVSGGDSGDEHSQGVDWDKVKCAACNRATQRPDLQVFLFGSTYDARQVWNSSRWDQQMPRELFLYKDDDPADEEYMHHPHNNLNSAHKRSAHSSSGTSTHKTPSKNRQMRAYESILSGEVRQYGGVHVLTSGDKYSSNSNRGSAKGTICIDDDMAQAVQNRKRRIVLSDGSDDEAPVSKASRDSSGHRRSAGSEGPNNTVDLTSSNNTDGYFEDHTAGDSGGESSDLEILPSAEERHAARVAQQAEEEQELARAWWKQKFPREFTSEAEKVFMLSAHCKNRTRLYHTLLHYKFRLLMNVREKIQSIANVMCGQQMAESSSTGGSGRKSSSNAYLYDTSWESWEGPDRQYLLEAAVEELKQDSAFMEGEARRFQALVKETERRYGGREEPAHNNIWGDDDHHGSHPSYAARHNSSSSAGSGSGRQPMSQQTKTIMGWLTKQK